MSKVRTGLAGAAAGAANGLLGAGGGMILVPLLRKAGTFEEEEVFPASVAVIMPVCLVSLAVTALRMPLPWEVSLPYLLGGILGGLLSGMIGKKIPVKWLHRILGIVVLYGGIRYLC